MQRLQAHKFQSRRNATDCHKDVGSNYRQVHCPATICSGLHIKQPPVREAVHPPHRVSLLLQTCAGKGKGKQGMRQGMGSQRTGPQMPPTPAVDPENVEFVLFVQNPKVSPQSASSVPSLCHTRFLSSQNDLWLQLPQWLPVSIVKGGRPANLLVGTMESEWGKKLFGKALIRSIAQPLWKVSHVLASPVAYRPSICCCRTQCAIAMLQHELVNARLKGA
jgi:hypothetical protein